MKLYFYRGHQPNFGDELNHWLLPKVFPGFFDDGEAELFLGIGSVLFDHHPQAPTKIVFGSGYGGYTPLPRFDARWKVYCVRGPRTAAACGLPPDKVAGDAAILIHRFHGLAPARRVGASFMPHWESLQRGQWEAVCRLAGVRFIDPRRPVEQVLQEIATSEVLVTEAMHGAIVADALRVPWVPVLPFHRSHHFKWHDWAESLGMRLAPYALWPSSALEAHVARYQGDGGALKWPGRPLGLAIRVANRAFLLAAAARLQRAARVAPSLSSDAALARALDRLESSAERIRQDFAVRA